MVSAIQCQEAAKLIIGYQEYLSKSAWPKETGEPLKGILLFDLRYNRYSVMEVRRNKNCIVCGDSGLAQKPVPILSFPLARLRDSTSRLHEAVAKRVKLSDRQVMLFFKKNNKTIKIERGHSLRRLSLGPRRILTAVMQDGSEYREAIVRLSET